MPRSEYTDIGPDTIMGRLLAEMRRHGLTTHEVKKHIGTRWSLSHMISRLEDMHGYDVRGVKAPRRRTANREDGKGKRGLVYFVAGRHNWEHTEYESYVTPEGLLQEED